MDPHTALSFYPLTFVPDLPETIIGRSDIDSYASFPEDGVALLKYLQAGNSPAGAAIWYQQHYEEPLDINDFLETLQDLQFLREAGTEEQTLPASIPSRFWQRIGRAAFSFPAWIIYAAVCGYCLELLLRFPYLRPDYHHIFFTRSLVLVELGISFGQLPGIFFHELYHVLAGNRLGIASRLRIGRRLYFLVFETDLTGLWRVPRKAHYLPFLAGMLGDILWFSCFTILASLTYNPEAPFALPGSFFLALAFSTVLRFIWQFYFYLQTDLYYVFMNALRCINLQETTVHYLWNRIYRAVGRRDRLQDEELWHPRDRQVARWYAYFFLVGYLLTVGTLFLVGIPAIWQMFILLLSGIAHASFDAHFWDSLVFILLNGAQFVLVVTIFLHERRLRKKESVHSALWKA